MPESAFSWLVWDDPECVVKMFYGGKRKNTLRFRHALIRRVIRWQRNQRVARKTADLW